MEYEGGDCKAEDLGCVWLFVIGQNLRSQA